jgi:guanylate kinase
MSTLFIISAPSGSGKSTLVNELRTLVPHLDFSVSYTTRTPRGSEQEGREYHYITRQEFERMAAAGDFLEYADVFGNYYGTPSSYLDEAQRKGNDLLLDIDVQGARQVRLRVPEAVSIFVLPPDRQTLERRLRSRSRAENVVSEEIILRRLTTAGNEIVHYSEYEYILVNDRLEQAIEELKAIVLSERWKASGKALPSDGLHLAAVADRCRRENTLERVRAVLASFEIPCSA